MLELFSESRAYWFDYEGKSYTISISWEDTTNYLEELVFLTEDNKEYEIIGEEKEKILTAFEKELKKKK